MATPKPNSDLAAEQVRAALDYDPDTGVFIWRHRPVTDRFTKSWNTRFAGKVAGCAQKVSRADRWYRTIHIAGKLRYAHRLAWLYVHGEWPPAGMEIDHIDGNSLNNRIDNLRLATARQNSANTRTKRKGLKGAYPHSESGLWNAKITSGGKTESLGYFHSEAAAHEAYKIASKRVHGEFGRAQ